METVLISHLPLLLLDSKKCKCKCIIIIIIMACRQIPTMTKTHHGGNLSVMNMVGICRWQNPTIDNDDDEVGLGGKLVNSDLWKINSSQFLKLKPCIRFNQSFGMLSAVYHYKLTQDLSFLFQKDDSQRSAFPLPRGDIFGTTTTLPQGEPLAQWAQPDRV